MSTTTTAAPPVSTIPGEDGQCGYQHGMAPCLPANGLECCSLNGYCGSNETYCLTEFGCQYGCVPASYFLNSTTVVTLSTILTVSPTSSQPITLTGLTLTTATKVSQSSTSTTSAAPVADHRSGLSGKEIAGVVVGCIIGATLFSLIVAILWLRRNRRNARRKAEAKAAAAAEAGRAAAAAALAAQQVRPSTEEPLEYYGGLVQDNDFEMVNNGDANRG